MNKRQKPIQRPSSSQHRSKQLLPESKPPSGDASRSKLGRLACAASAMVLAHLAGACADIAETADQDPLEFDGLYDKGLSVTNGLHAINGLKGPNGVRSVNGLRTLNGLSTTNGLKTLNGVTTINGLKTFNGVRTVNGLRTVNGKTTTEQLSVDCTGRTLASFGGTCTGEPDGLLSRKTGMMASDDGIETAKYLVRCALPPSSTVTVKDYRGVLVSMPGAMGLSPGWETGQCDRACEERVSACLIALTNGDGEHIEVELTSTLSQIGTSHTMVGGKVAFPYQEGVAYGNLFLDPPRAFLAGGVSYPTNTIYTRACTQEYGFHCITVNVGGTTDTSSTSYCTIGDYAFCPYDWSGTVATKCSQTSMFDPGDGAGARGTATTCDGWNNPLTIWRNIPYAP